MAVLSYARTARPLERELDLGALERNHARLHAHLPAGTLVLASVKANAYGHGVVAVARRLEELGVAGVATASVGDALAVREAGISCRVALFGGQLPGALAELATSAITPSVANRESAVALAAAGSRAGVFVEIDGGLGRTGLAGAETEQVIREILLPAGMAVEGVYTHLPFTDAEGERWARAGLRRFDATLERLRQGGFEPPLAQALSSPGVSAGLDSAANAVCVGRILYGLAPQVGSAAQWGLEPVFAALRTRIVHVGSHAAGARVASGGRYQLRAPSRTAVVPFGRSDGYLPAPAAEAVMIHRGRRVGVIGASLEHTTLDLADGGAEVGEEVVVLGRGQGCEVTLAELASWFGVDPLDALVMLDAPRLAASPA